MIHQRFQIDALLLGRIQRIFLGLQLRLHPGQDLQVAPDLRRQFAHVLSLELANLFFLIRQSLPRRLQLAFEKICGVF